MPTSVRINERYEKREILGQGGMGVVWWAFDHVLKREVSLKTIRDVRDKTALDLFRKECATLASMAHPNIVEIYDIGATEENGHEVPYFVMPLLRGLTLDKLIETASSRLTTERCVDILLQVCRGLQAAHDQGLVHRDLKPSNIFVLQDDSVKIIDFGVAHLVDVHSTVKHGGTLLYMAPEQIMLKKPTPASDLFSLGVVAFEAITRRRPFDANSREDIAHHILSEMPPPAFQVNPGVSLPISQVIHKAMAKQPYQRFATAKEFGENLQKALHNEPIESFSSARIEPRVQRVKKALEQGELEFAKEIIAELESEALLHPDLGALRKSTDEAIRSRTIQQLLDTARRRFEEEEYQLALQKLQEILNLDPANTEAHSLRGDIENKRSSRQIEDWLRLARQHMENHAYGHARQALQNVLQMRPKETKAQQLLSEVDRREQEYQKIRQEKENVYNAALDALDKGDLSSALTKLERVLEMDRRAPDTFSPDRAAVYQKLYNKVRSEHDQIVSSYQEARNQLENGNFAAALASCDEVLQRSPSNALFQSLKFDIEDRQRQEVSAYVARIDREVDAEADLNRKIRLLEEALTKYPDESHFQRSLHTIRSKRDLVESIVSKARAFEEKGQYSEALAQWEILRNIYRLYPGLDVESERVSRRKQHKDRADLKSRWVQQVDHALNVGDFSRALDLCAQALAEYPGDAELLTLERAANQELQRLERAQALLRDAEVALSERNQARGLELLREANQLDPANAAIRQRLLRELLGEAKALIDGNWQEADQYLQQALDLDPGNALARSLKTLVQDKKQEFCLTDALSRARALQASSDLTGAISVLDEALALYPGDNRLSQLRSQLDRNKQGAERAVGRKRDLDELRMIQREAETVYKKDELETLFVRTQLIATRYSDDKEFTEVTEELRRRVERSQQPPLQQEINDRPISSPHVPPSTPRPATVLPPRLDSQPRQQETKSLFRGVQAVTAKALWSVASLPRDLDRAMQGKLPWSRLAVPTLVLAGGVLLFVGIAQIILPRDSSEQANLPLTRNVPSTPPIVDSLSQPGPSVANVDLKPTIQVVAEMDGVEVSMDGVPLENRGNGLFVLDKIPEGDRTLQVSAPDGAKATLRVRMKDKAIPEVLELTAERARAFAAAAFQGAARLFGFAPGEKVRAGWEEGVTQEIGSEGLAQDAFGTGAKVVFVEYGADRRQHELQLGTSPTLFLALTPDTPIGTLEVLAGSTDVQVFVNDRPRRFVPLRGTLYMGLVPGRLRVRVERPGHFPDEKAVVLKRGESQKLVFDLRPIPKVARLTIRNAGGTEIVVGSQTAQRPGPDGVLAMDVASGRQRVQIARQGFRPIAQEYDFVAGEPKEIDVSKLSFERVVVTSDVTFQVTPDVAEIKVSSPDGRVTTTRSGVATAYREGRYNFEATAPGYENYSSNFEVKSGDSQTIPFSMRKKAAEAAPPTVVTSAMSGWNDAPEWKLGSDGYYVKGDDGQSIYKSAAGLFSFTTPCKTRRLFGKGDCKVIVFLTGSERGELRFEITDNKVRRREGQRASVDKVLASKITGEMRIRVRVTSAHTMLEVNGQETDSVDGDYTKGRLGINSVDMMKDFKYSTN